MSLHNLKIPAWDGTDLSDDADVGETVQWVAELRFFLAYAASRDELVVVDLDADGKLFVSSIPDIEDDA